MIIYIQLKSAQWYGKPRCSINTYKGIYGVNVLQNEWPRIFVLPGIYFVGFAFQLIRTSLFNTEANLKIAF
jgi:hypothetical protein